ncbi:hypothetical protein P691DRAFT_764554 [Macrolepiota fuliginosa MF-IS2]|uniref:Uncharacterized protein n=1 Tax=Macrolepiota fuliginosa MF-IS2 TaxID=1400762 RepID=A0A9P5X4B8_9AGAR|nr:hypothetical protein P691DRAFT_764554 [Macrolepiota fuliginosa MF-IS2]
MSNSLVEVIVIIQCKAEWCHIIIIPLIIFMDGRKGRLRSTLLRRAQSMVAWWGLVAVWSRRGRWDALAGQCILNGPVSDPRPVEAVPPVRAVVVVCSMFVAAVYA